MPSSSTPPADSPAPNRAGRPAARAAIEALHAYAPGEQPTWADTHRSERPVVKLNTNENPHPPSPRAMEAVAALPAEALRLYPPPLSNGLRAAAAAALNDPEDRGFTADFIIGTNGGDELLRLLITVFCEPAAGGATPVADLGAGGVGLTTPSYSLYGVLAGIHGAAVTEVPRDPETLAPPAPEALAEAWNAAGCRLGFVVNPHAPSGRREGRAWLTTLADAFEGLLVVDEAYVDFADADAAGLVAPAGEARADVLLLRSLSKGYGLAGLRVGFGVGHPSLITLLDKARDSYNLDAFAQAAAAAALADRAYAESTWSSVRGQRVRLTGLLRERGLGVLDSQSNFVLARVPGGADEARRLYRGLKEAGVLIRHFDTPGLDDRLRITVGLPEQVDRLVAALDGLLARSGGSGSNGTDPQPTINPSEAAG